MSKYKVLEYDCFTEERGKKTLYLFPEKPFWFMADNSIKVIIDYFQKKCDFDTLSNILVNQFYYPAGQINEIVDGVYNLLDKAQLFDEKILSTSEKIMFVKEKFAIPVLNITKKCNLYCKHCYANATHVPAYSRGKELATEEWKKVIFNVGNLLNSIGDDRILLTGGEPFLREDITELVEYIVSLGYRPFINTNSLLISEEQMSVLSRCNAELLVSLDGSTKEVHEYLRGKNSYDKAIDQIRKLKMMGVITKLSFTVHEKNIHQIEGFLQFAQEINAYSIAINNLSVLHRADETGIERVNTSELNAELHRLANKNEFYFQCVSMTDYANLGAILLENLKFIYCGVGAASLCIDSNGDIYPCYNTMVEELKLGNVLHDDLMHIWVDSPLLEKLRNLSVDTLNAQCSNCVVRYYCGGGCRGETYYRYKDINAPYPYCDDMKKTIIDIMFILSENTSLFQSKVQSYFELKNRFLNETQKEGH